MPTNGILNCVDLLNYSMYTQGNEHLIYIVAESSDVKIMCSLWYEFCVLDEILYHTGKEVYKT